MTEVWILDTGYACAGVIVKDGVVIEAADIFRWTIGKPFKEVKAWPKIQFARKVVDTEPEEYR